MSGQKHSGCEESQGSHCEPIAAQRPAQGEAEFDIYTNHREFSFSTAAFGCEGWLQEGIGVLKHFTQNQHFESSWFGPRVKILYVHTVIFNGYDM